MKTKVKVILWVLLPICILGYAINQIKTYNEKEEEEKKEGKNIYIATVGTNGKTIFDDDFIQNTCIHKSFYCKEFKEQREIGMCKHINIYRYGIDSVPAYCDGRTFCNRCFSSKNEGEGYINTSNSCIVGNNTPMIFQVEHIVRKEFIKDNAFVYGYKDGNYELLPHNTNYNIESIYYDVKLRDGKYKISLKKESGNGSLCNLYQINNTNFYLAIFYDLSPYFEYNQNITLTVTKDSCAFIVLNNTSLPRDKAYKPDVYKDKDSYCSEYYPVKSDSIEQGNDNGMSAGYGKVR